MSLRSHVCVRTSNKIQILENPFYVKNIEKNLVLKIV